MDVWLPRHVVLSHEMEAGSPHSPASLWEQRQEVGTNGLDFKKTTWKLSSSPLVVFLLSHTQSLCHSQLHRVREMWASTTQRGAASITKRKEESVGTVSSSCHAADITLGRGELPPSVYLFKPILNPVHISENLV